jgi:hypothetical protein
MKISGDTKTAELLPNFDLAGEVPAKPTEREKGAERARRFRERHGVTAITVNLSTEQVEAFNAYIAARNAKLTAEKRLTKNGVIGKLIDTQLLRKR